jgi:hypothetical protein
VYKNQIHKVNDNNGCTAKRTIRIEKEEGGRRGEALVYFASVKKLTPVQEFGWPRSGKCRSCGAHEQFPKTTIAVCIPTF